MCIVYNIWPCCSNRIMSVLSTFYVSVSVVWLVEAAHWITQIVHSCLPYLWEPLTSSVFQDVRTHGHLIPPNVDWSVASWLCSESNQSVLCSLFSDIRVNSAYALLRKTRHWNFFTEGQWRVQWVYSKCFSLMQFELCMGFWHKHDRCMR